MPNLGQDSNRFSSCCYYGIWILYADVNYNQNNQNVSSQYTYIIQVNDILEMFIKQV